jgi:hypothetical protein
MYLKGWPLSDICSADEAPHKDGAIECSPKARSNNRRMAGDNLGQAKTQEKWKRFLSSIRNLKKQGNLGKWTERQSRQQWGSVLQSSMGRRNNERAGKMGC